MTGQQIPLPKLSAPASRALESVGITHLAQLDGASEREFLELHGLGPAQLGVLREALGAHGFAFSGPVSQPRATGRNDNATALTAIDPRDWISSLASPKRVTAGYRLLEIFGRATGAEPEMWGPSIVGYGRHHYVYDTGREGDTCRVGFSPRSAALSLYGLLGVRGGEAILDRLGPHREGKGCLYVSSLSRVDETVLGELVATAWRQN